MKNTARSDRNASEKEKVSGQTYRLPIWNGILEHCSKIKDAIWLLLLFINWTTEEEAGAGRSADRGGPGGLEGIVLGGIVVSDGITAKEFPGTTRKTTLRWRERLASHGFIRQDRKNYGYVIRVLKSKKWDAEGAKGTFRIPVSTGILDHYKKLKSSIWLLLWYVDTTTVEEDGQGKVLGGKPVRDSQPAEALGVSDDTIASWRENLELGKYIRTTRTPFGHIVVVAKSKKWVGKKPSEMSQNPVSQMSQNPVSLKNPTSEMSRFSGSDVPIPRVRCPKNRGEMSQKPGNKEDIAVDFTGTVQDVAEEAAAAPADVPVNPNPKSNTQAPVGKSSRVSKEAWESIGIPPGGSTKFILAWGRFYAKRLEDEKLSDTMEDCIQWCKANGIKPTPPFYDARRQLKEREAEDDSEVRRFASPDFKALAADFNAKQEARHEAEKARFNALSREEKLVELKAKLADYGSWMTPAKEAGKQIANWAVDRKAELERQIAEYSSPVCQEEISLTAEEEAQFLSQFPEAWDSPHGGELLGECQEVAA